MQRIFGMRRRSVAAMTDGDEYDWLTKEGRRALGYRKWLRWLKRKYNKRLRKELKRASEEWDE
jgi:hypothetical protein